MTNHLRLKALSNVQISPWKMDRSGTLPMFKGGISYPEALPEYLRHSRGQRLADMNSADTATPEKLPGEYIWGGCIHEHFGHFLAEFSHRLWVTKEKPYQSLTVLFSAPEGSDSIPSHFTQVLEYWGVENWQINNRATEVETLVIGESGKFLNETSKQDYLRYLAGPASQLEDLSFPKKVCILRGHLPHSKLLGEKHLEELLVEQGYEAIVPEKHSLKDQLKYIANAEHLIISEGSALHLVDLLPAINANVAVINRRANTHLATTTFKGKTDKLALFEDSAIAYAPKSGQGRDNNKALSYAPFPALHDFLSTNGFISGDVWHEPDLEAELLDFITGDSETTNPVSTELARRSRVVRNLNIENTYLKAKLALVEKDMDSAKQHIQHYLWMAPTGDNANELASGLKELEALLGSN